jgi:membrane protease YdiL (CAAX protease family)
MHSGRTFFARYVFGRPHAAGLATGLLTVPYLIYAAGTGDFRWTALGWVLLIAAPVLALYSAVPVRQPARFNWQDLAVGLWLVAVVLFHLFTGIWNVPRNLDFMGRLFVLSAGALTWNFIRPVPALGYTIDVSTRALVAALTNFLLFAAIAIPVGFAMGFTSWNPRWPGVLNLVLTFLEILLFIAVLEELFFRGFLQSLLTESIHSWWAGRLIASAIFGLFHILHAPFPNWRYVMLASIAGWFYGSAYRSGGTLLSSVLVHASVDTVWRIFFTKS